MIVGLSSLVIGVIAGALRLLNSMARLNIPVEVVRILILHSEFIIVGFITTLILNERYMGIATSGVRIGSRVLGVGLISSITGYILSILNKILIGIPMLRHVGVILLALGGLALASSIILVARHLNINTVILSIAGVASYLTSIIYMIYGLTTDYIIYSYMIILYPVLFILGERIQLARITLVRRINIGEIYLLGIFIILTLYASILMFSLTLLTISIIFLLALAAFLYLYETPAFRLLGRGIYAMKYQARHIKTAYHYLILGLISYIATINIYRNIYFLDISIHMIALGFIGLMLIAHGPFVMATMRGRRLNVDRINIRPYIILNLAIITRVIPNIIRSITIASGDPIPILDIFYWASSILIIIVIPVFFKMVLRAIS